MGAFEVEVEVEFDPPFEVEGRYVVLCWLMC